MMSASLSGDAFHIQRDQTTKYDRYPEIFAAVRRLCGAAGALDVLSFGCSTGEEPLTLGELYLPQARIVALEASPAILDIARAKGTLDGRITWEVSSPEALARHGPYDVIFAMSVLCRWPTLENVPDASEVFPYEQYLHMVTMLDTQLRPGGLFVIYNAHYSFADTVLVSGYEIVLDPEIADSGYVKKYDRRGREIIGYRASDVIYRKLRDPPPCSGRLLRFIDRDGRPLGSVCTRL
jgi:2-polyprenyl-3-methyl-5-hydroxy-6-metoxy-1,4-benzoquinol methylase